MLCVNINLYILYHTAAFSTISLLLGLVNVLHNQLSRLGIHKFLSVHKLQGTVRLFSGMHDEHIIVVILQPERECAFHTDLHRSCKLHPIIFTA